ncbi:hypothetical protein LCGC14_0476250 [marine sediment metagenome]|uniref:Uncharacterized protein n=1 Tax=marine sediment metagenome TaxID=412755 RepID=A0A0F9STG9_9ZZZZ
MGDRDKKVPSTSSLGKVKREKSEEVKIFDRRIIVWVKEFESGSQRTGSFFADKNKMWLTKNNSELRKMIQRLEEEVKKKDKY